MNILMPTLYSNARGGSVKILLTAAEVLKKEHHVIVRANMAEADEKTQYSMPDILDTASKKITAGLIMIKAIVLELLYLRKKNIDVIYVHDELTLYVYGSVAKFIGCKVVWHLHAQEGRNINWFLRDRLSDYKIYISKHSQKRSVKRAYVVYNPITDDQYGHIENQGDPINISIIGSISDNKNQYLGLEILNRLREIGDSNYRLNIYGYLSNELYVQKLKDYIDLHDLNTEAVFHGYQDKKVIYKNTDVALITSRFESFGLVLIESIGSGIPVVAKDIDSAREIFDLIGYPKEMLFNDIEQACRAVMETRSMTMETYSKTVREVFSLNRFSSELHGIFKEIEDNED